MKSDPFTSQTMKNFLELGEISTDSSKFRRKSRTRRNFFLGLHFVSMCDVEFQALQGCDSADLKLVEIQHLAEIARVEGPHFGGFLKTVWLNSIGIKSY